MELVDRRNVQNAIVHPCVEWTRLPDVARAGAGITARAGDVYELAWERPAQ